MLDNQELEFVVKRFDNLVEMDDLVVESVREINMILLNLKIVTAHLGEQGKRSGIVPICNVLHDISDRMEQKAKEFKKERQQANDIEKKIKDYLEEEEKMKGFSSAR